MRRVRHFVCRVLGVSEAALLVMEFFMALDKSTADLAVLSSLASAVVAELQSAQSAASSAQAVAAQAQSDLGAADDTVSAALQQIIAILQPVVPAQ